MPRKIELWCNQHDQCIEISEQVYEFLKAHMILQQANETEKRHYKFVIRAETPIEEYE